MKLAASCGLGLVLLEAGLRILDVDPPLAKIWRWHPQLGWTQHPGRSLEYELDGQAIRVEFNALGFRDVDHAVAKPPGTRRVVVVGDSFCEAAQVNLDETFHRRLEALLDGRGATDWEVVNLGVGDFGPAQELLALETYGFDYSPDVVVCQVFPLNDIGNDSIDLHGLCRSHNDVYRPYFVEAAGGLELRRPLLHWLRWSRGFQLAERAVLAATWRLAGSGDEARRRARLRERGFTGLDPLLYTFVADADQPEAIRAGWRVTERILDRMVDRCAEHGARFVLLVIPWEVCIGPSWDDYVAGLPPPPLDRAYPERRLAAWAAGRNVTAVSMTASFEREIDRFKPCRDGHLNPEGHAMVAAALAAVID